MVLLFLWAGVEDGGILFWCQAYLGFILTVSVSDMYIIGEIIYFGKKQMAALDFRRNNAASFTITYIVCAFAAIFIADLTTKVIKRKGALH